MNRADRYLPTPAELSELLSIHPSDELGPFFGEGLLDPLTDFMSRTGKQFRTQLLECAFRSEDAGSTPAIAADEWCRRGASLVEAIHSASMIVDDIEDESLERRGAPTLHQKFGTAVALNAGNWLYFWPLREMREWKMAPEKELAVSRLCVDAILLAHCGQAIDVGVRIDTVDQSAAAETCLGAIELKTGALMGLAAELGAILAGAQMPRAALWRDFGKRFGIALQMFDDIANFASSQLGPKRLEDLRLRRPSWIWACAAQTSPEAYRAFRAAVDRLPDETALADWSATHAIVGRAREGANQYLAGALNTLEASIGAEKMAEIRLSVTRLTGAYV